MKNKNSPNKISIIFTGDILTERFTLACLGWRDEGYEDPTNTVLILDNFSGAGAASQATKALYFKYLLKKNNISVPIAEGGKQIFYG